MKKFTHPLMQLLAMLLVTLGIFLLMSVLTAVVAMLGGSPQATGNMMWLQALTQLLTFLLPVVWMTRRYYRGQQRQYYGLDFSAPKWGLAGAGVVMLLLLMPLIDWLTVWNDSWHWSGAWRRLEEMLRQMGELSEGVLAAFLDRRGVGALLANLLVVALVPALCEEVFFRAGVQNLLHRWVRNPHVAVWLTAAIFSLAHGELFAFLPRFLMGALLGYLYLYSRSLVPNVGVHFVNNAVVVVAYWLRAEGLADFDPEAPMRIPALLTACCALASAGLFVATFLAPGRGKTGPEKAAPESDTGIQK